MTGTKKGDKNINCKVRRCLLLKYRFLVQVSKSAATAHIICLLHPHKKCSKKFLFIKSSLGQKRFNSNYSTFSKMEVSCSSFLTHVHSCTQLFFTQKVVVLFCPHKNCDAHKTREHVWQFQVKSSPSQISQTAIIDINPQDGVWVKNISEKSKNPCHCSKMSLHKNFKLILEQKCQSNTFLKLTL